MRGSEGIGPHEDPAAGHAAGAGSRKARPGPHEDHGPVRYGPLADVTTGARPDISSIGFAIALWSGSRAVNVF
ncbi:hypothetical protein ACWEK7_11845, partial [Streptomyces californicus]